MRGLARQIPAVEDVARDLLLERKRIAGLQQQILYGVPERRTLQRVLGQPDPQRPAPGDARRPHDPGIGRRLDLDRPARHQHAARIFGQLQGHRGPDALRRPGPLLPRLLLLREGETLRRCALVCQAPRFGRSRAQAPARPARIRHAAHDRGHRLRHRPPLHQTRPLPHNEVDGPGSQIAVLPLRGNLPQIPQNRRLRARLEMVSRTGRRCRRRVHQQQRLRSLHRKWRQGGLPRPVRIGGGARHRGRARPRLQQEPQCISQQYVLLAEHFVRPPGHNPQDRRQLPDGRRFALHRPPGLADDGIQGSVHQPRSAPRTVDPHAGIHAYRFDEKGSAEPVDLHDGIPAHQVRRPDQLRVRRLQPLVHRSSDHPLGRGLPQLRRGQGRNRNPDAE